MKLADGNAVKSADRVFDVLEFLVESEAPQSFAVMSKALAIPKSSLFQLLRNLLGRGYVYQDKDSGHYRLGPKLPELMARMNAPSLAEIVTPFVENACRELNETFAFYVRSENLGVVISTSSGGQALRFAMQTGDSAPLYVFSAGRVLLSDDSTEQIDRYLSELKPEAFTQHSKVRMSDIRAALKKVQDEGFSYSLEEHTPGIVGIATAVRHNGGIVGAICIAIPAARFDEESDRQARRVLQSTAGAIGAAIDRQWQRHAQDCWKEER